MRLKYNNRNISELYEYDGNLYLAPCRNVIAVDTLVRPGQYENTSSRKQQTIEWLKSCSFEFTS